MSVTALPKQGEEVISGGANPSIFVVSSVHHNDGQTDMIAKNPSSQTNYIHRVYKAKW
jgi:hypothetical protein